MKTLADIQQELKAPKSQRNAFGKYNYRSCEDILTAVKPILGDWSLTISDEIVLIGDRYYVKATASIRKPGAPMETGTFHEATAFAREPLEQKGMSSPQVTGSASSYSRKYALNGLFAIDDTRDDDATNTHGNKPRGKPVKPPVAKLDDDITSELKRLTDDFKDTDSLIDIYKELGVENFNQIKNNTPASKEMILTQLKDMD